MAELMTELPNGEEVTQAEYERLMGELRAAEARAEEALQECKAGLRSWDSLYIYYRGVAGAQIDAGIELDRASRYGEYDHELAARNAPWDDGSP